MLTSHTRTHPSQEALASLLRQLVIGSTHRLVTPAVCILNVWLLKASHL